MCYSVVHFGSICVFFLVYVLIFDFVRTLDPHIFVSFARFYLYIHILHLYIFKSGIATVYAVKSAGLAIGIGIGSSCIVFISFIWGIFIFQEEVHSKLMSCFAILCMMIGLLGMSYFSSPEIIAVQDETVIIQEVESLSSPSPPISSETTISTNLIVQGHDNDQDNVIHDDKENSRHLNGTLATNDENHIHNIYEDEDENDHDDNHMIPPSRSTNPMPTMSSNEYTVTTHRHNKMDVFMDDAVVDTTSRLSSSNPIYHSATDLTSMNNIDDNDDNGENDRSGSRMKQTLPARYSHLSLTDEYSSRSYNNNSFLESTTSIEDSPVWIDNRLNHRRKATNYSCLPCTNHNTNNHHRHNRHDQQQHHKDNDDGMTICYGRYYLTKRQLGMISAAFCGLYGGSILAPMKFANTDLKGTRYLLSFSIGSSIVTIFLWLVRLSYNSYIHGSIYIGYNSLPSFHIRVMWLPGGISGLLWSIGNYFSLISVLYLGEGVGYPLVQTSILVSGLWGIFYFQEVKGYNAISKWFLSSLITIFGILLLSHEHVSK